MEDNDDEILEELRLEKASYKSVLNKKKITKYELDEALLGEV